MRNTRKPAHKGLEAFRSLCHSIDDFAKEHCPDTPRTVEEIEALALSAFAAAGKVVGNEDAYKGLLKAAQRKLSVPAKDRTPCV